MYAAEVWYLFLRLLRLGLSLRTRMTIYHTNSNAMRSVFRQRGGG